MKTAKIFPLVLSAALLLQTAQEAAAKLLATRMWPTAESVRVVFESDEALDYRVFNLNNPPRIVVDIITRGDDEKIKELPKADIGAAADYLFRVRAARHNEKRLRAVFEVAKGARFKVERLPPVRDYGHRLVFEIEPETPPDPLLALLRELRPPEGERRPFVVVIDPGHGGEDPGAVSPRGNYEKRVVLAISKRLRDELARRPGLRGVLTRDGDYFLPLAARARRAQRLKGDAMISIHADSVASSRPRGSSVYVLSARGASTKFARDLARGENLSDLVGGTFVSGDAGVEGVLRTFTRDGKERASRELASLIIKRLGSINRVHSRRVESAGFAVLKAPSVPSVLVEVAFISNPADEKLLHDSNFQSKVAAQIADAVAEYAARQALEDS